MTRTRPPTSRERRIGYGYGMAAAGLFLLVIVGVIGMLGGTFDWAVGCVAGMALFGLGTLAARGAERDTS
jgi:hypothetical protein